MKDLGLDKVDFLKVIGTARLVYCGISNTPSFRDSIPRVYDQTNIGIPMDPWITIQNEIIRLGSRVTIDLGSRDLWKLYEIASI